MVIKLQSLIKFTLKQENRKPAEHVTIASIHYLLERQLLKKEKFLQHIRPADCRSRLERQWETPNFDPPVEPKLVGDRAENCMD